MSDALLWLVLVIVIIRQHYLGRAVEAIVELTSSQIEANRKIIGSMENTARTLNDVTDRLNMTTARIGLTALRKDTPCSTS